MLSDVAVKPMIPVRDLKTARKFYEETLGFKPVHVEPEVVATYQSGQGVMHVYQSEFGGTNKGTAALWEVSDLEGTVKSLKDKGVTFEHYDDMKGITREGDIHKAHACAPPQGPARQAAAGSGPHGSHRTEPSGSGDSSRAPPGTARFRMFFVDRPPPPRLMACTLPSLLSSW